MTTRSTPAALRSPAAFAALRREGRRARRGTITVTWAPDGSAGEAPTESATTSRPRVAYAVGRRAGGAVVRNRIRRRLRAIVRDALPGMAPGAYLFGAGPEAATLPYEELRTTVNQALRAVTSR